MIGPRYSKELLSKLTWTMRESVVEIEDVQYVALWDIDYQPTEGSPRAPSQHYVPTHRDVILEHVLTGIRVDGEITTCTHDILERLSEKHVDSIVKQLEDELNEY